MKLPQNLHQKLETRKENNAFRQLTNSFDLTDFSSNDYIGFATSKSIFEKTHQYLLDNNINHNGATGSRLLSGNHQLFDIIETKIAKFHNSQAALIFNSGFDANIGFFQAVPQRHDLILFDSLCHASIRDGIGISLAKAFKFEHNDHEDLEVLILKYQSHFENIYVVTESVFSMDGDSPALLEIAKICEQQNCFLVIDEAHALGVIGQNGAGLVQDLQLEAKIFARIMTFGKGLGCHGAAILGSSDLRDYLVNFARSFIYTTGLSPHSVATILVAYQHLEEANKCTARLRNNIVFFNQQKSILGLKPLFVRSKSAIQSAIFSGNNNVKNIAEMLKKNGFDVKPILSPTVPAGQERLRFCLHEYNTFIEIENVLKLLSNTVYFN